MHANSQEVGPAGDATPAGLFDYEGDELCPYPICNPDVASPDSSNSTAGQAQKESVPAVLSQRGKRIAVRQCAAHSSKLPLSLPYSERARFWREIAETMREARAARAAHVS